ncbi:hypothetical protein [Segatella bryantii]|jgi:hypothetical protein|nr:hypothetical protein [Segatella bryantii]
MLTQQLTDKEETALRVVISLANDKHVVDRYIQGIANDSVHILR